MVEDGYGNFNTVVNMACYQATQKGPAQYHNLSSIYSKITITSHNATSCITKDDENTGARFCLFAKKDEWILLLLDEDVEPWQRHRKKAPSFAHDDAFLNQSFSIDGKRFFFDARLGEY